MEKNNKLFAPGMAFVPEASATLCESLASFGPKKKKSEKDRKVKKNLEDVRRSILSLLRPRFEDELNSDDVENMRWSTFVAVNRQVGDETVMTDRKSIVQV